jgi:hypothetical protein
MGIPVKRRGGVQVDKIPTKRCKHMNGCNNQNNAKKSCKTKECKKKNTRTQKKMQKHQPDAGLEPATVRFPELERTKSRTLYRLS